MKCERIITALLATTLAVNSLLTVKAEQTFSEFEDEMFKDMMSEDYTTLHYALKDYEQYGIEKPEVTIGSAEWDYEEAVEEYEDYQERLHAFDYDSLSDEEQTDYDTIDFYLETQIQLNSYPYFDWAFNSAEGVIDGLLTTFTEFVFYEKEDIDDYLTTLSTVPAYLDDCIELTKRQAEKGYFLTDSMLKNTEEAIDKFVEKTDDNELIQVFNENIDAFDGLSESERQTYKDKNKDIVLNEYIPAYQKVEEELEKLKGSRKGQYNVCSLEDGKEYYEALAKYKTSLDMSVEDILDICTQFLNTAIDELIDLQTNSSSNLDETVDIESAEEVLKYLESHMDELPTIDKVNYTVSYLDPSVANDSIIAYYMEPPIDDVQDNVIKINGDNISDTTELYYTLAHEGFPGHLYQINYYLQSDPALIRTQLTNMGYQEGWGMYASKLALQQSSMSEDAAEYYSLMTQISYVMDAAVDLGVNGIGWGTSQVSNYLENLYLNSDIAKELYDFVTAQPGTILPYGVGIAMFETFEDKARNALGDSFDQKEFNEVLLKGGDRPFSVVEKDLDKYLGIEDNKENTKVNDNSDDDKTVEENTEVNWVLYGGAGTIIALIGIVALIGVYKHRKDNPFQS